MAGLMTWALAALCLFAASARAAPANPADPAAVVAAERAFAARAGLVGIGPSFLEYITDDAIVFSPDPLLAKAVYGVLPPPKLPKDGGTKLNWWPNFAGVARSGDLAQRDLRSVRCARRPLRRAPGGLHLLRRPRARGAARRPGRAPGVALRSA